MLINFIIDCTSLCIISEINYFVVLAEQVSHIPPCCYHPQLSDQGSSGEFNHLIQCLSTYIYTLKPSFKRQIHLL